MFVTLASPKYTFKLCINFAVVSAMEASQKSDRRARHALAYVYI